MSTGNDSREVNTLENETFSGENDNSDSTKETPGGMSGNSGETPENSSDERDEKHESLLADLYSERDKRKKLQGEIKVLSEKLEEHLGLKEALDKKNKEYSRLEELLCAGGGDLAGILDSKKFSNQLFNSEDSVTDVLKGYSRSNPGNTQRALHSSSGAKNDSGPDLNTLFRSAALG